MPKLEPIVFFGTPEFALPSLHALCESKWKPALVVTRPARPAGRGQEVKEPPVAVRAHELGLEVAQPESVRDETFLERLRELEPGLVVVVAFGQIFPAELLDLPAQGCVNVHASLLPKYRGAAPIYWAIASGEKRTGVSVQQMVEALDEGPLIHWQDTDIGPEETAGELTERLSSLGAETLLEALATMEKGGYKVKKQSDDAATYAHRLSRQDGKINWALDAREIANRMRAANPWPGTHAIFRGREVKILRATPIDWEQAPFGSAGTYLGLRQGRISILCGGNTILGLEQLQRAGKTPVRPSEFANGERLRVGDRFA